MIILSITSLGPIQKSSSSSQLLLRRKDKVRFAIRLDVLKSDAEDIGDRGQEGSLSLLKVLVRNMKIEVQRMLNIRSESERDKETFGVNLSR